MNRRPLLPLVLILASLPILIVSPALANYRLGLTASDSWPGGAGTTYTFVNGLKLGDAGGTTANELLTAGMYYNGTWPPQAELRIYHKAGAALILDQRNLWGRSGVVTYLSAVDTVDIDGNGQTDTVFVGNSQGTPAMSHLGIYRWTGSSLVKERLYNYSGPSSNIETRGLAIWTNVGIKQMVTIGYYTTATGTDYSQLGIWSWDGSSPNPTKNTLYNWTTTGGSGAGSQGFGVATGDVDGDGVPEIVTVGSSTYNSTSILSQMRIWGWSGSGVPLSKFTREWITLGQISIASSVSIRDLDGDGRNEIIVAGQAFESPFTRAELTIWSVDSQSNLNQLAETNWVTGTQSTTEFARVATGDVNGDGAVDIVTAGYTTVPSLGVDYGTTRVWSWEGTRISLNKAYLYTTNSQLLAVTVGDAEMIGKQDVIVAGFQTILSGRRGFVEVRDVAYVYGSFGIGVNPAPALAGQSVTISGTLVNATDGTPYASVLVSVEYSKDGAAHQLVATVTTDSQGRYASSFTPPGPGAYTVKATWDGDDEHMKTEATTTFTVNRAPSVIVLSTSTFNARPGETVTVSGYLYPASSETLTLTYTSPSGARTTRTVTSDTAGAFSDQYTITTAGTWLVSASWNGNTNTAPASSNSLRVETQPEPLGLSLSLYGFIIALAAMGLGGVALARRGGGRQTSAPPQWGTESRTTESPQKPPEPSK